jgi:hypothetical protein
MGTRGLWIVLLVAVGAAMVGFAVAALVGMRVSDPAVQGAMVGGVAGVTGGVLGAGITAWTARQTTDDTLAEARASREASLKDASDAREEARAEARRASFLADRKTAIVGYMSACDAAVSDAEAIPLAVARGERWRQPRVEETSRAWEELILLAPDLTSPAQKLSSCMGDLIAAHVVWGDDTRAAGHYVDSPDYVKKHRSAYNRVRADFIVAAGHHLGVDVAAQERRVHDMAELSEAVRRHSPEPNDATPPTA